MSPEKALDDLIKAGWTVIERDFEPNAFVNWRKRALDCVLVLVGPDHPYAKFFNAFLAQEARNSLLAGAGILEATRAQVVARRIGSDCLDSAETNF
jgi:hypothetical protein